MNSQPEIASLGAGRGAARWTDPLLMNFRHGDCFAGRLPLRRAVDRPARNPGTARQGKCDAVSSLPGRMPPRGMGNSQ